MEENINKTNKVSKPAWVFSSPPPQSLAVLCFSKIRRQKILDRALDPLKMVKATIGTNTENDNHADNADNADNDDTMSLMSFEDPVNFEEDMNTDIGDIAESNDLWETVLPKYVHSKPTSIVGGELVGTEHNSLVIYDPPPWVERPQKVYVKPGMEELFTCTSRFNHVPTLSMKNIPLPMIPELPTMLSVWKHADSKADSLSGSIDGDERASGGNTCGTTDPEMESSMEEDSSMEEHYFRFPEPLTSSVSDVCSMETDEKVVHVTFDLDRLDRKKIAGVKVDVNFNCQGEKRRRTATNCCDCSFFNFKKVKREKLNVDSLCSFIDNSKI